MAKKSQEQKETGVVKSASEGTQSAFESKDSGKENRKSNEAD
jgi:hypothetical protein